jgi:hypothetical protein
MMVLLSLHGLLDGLLDAAPRHMPEDPTLSNQPPPP